MPHVPQHLNDQAERPSDAPAPGAKPPSSDTARPSAIRESPAPSLKAQERKWAPLLVFGIFAVLSLAFWRLLEARELALLRDLARGEAQNLAALIEGDLRMRVAAIERMASRWERRGGTPEGEFLADAEAYQADLGGFQALEWVDAKLRVRWIHPLAGNEAALGLDMALEGTRRQALERARALGRPMQSGAYELVQGGAGILLAAPLDVGGRFDGYVVGILRIADWLERLIAASGGELPARARIQGREVFRQKDWDRAGASGPSAMAIARLEGGELEVELKLGTVGLRKRRSALPEVGGAAGLLLATLLALIVRLLNRVSAKARGLEIARQKLAESEGELSRRVEARTRSLGEAHKRLMEQSLLRHDMETAGQVQSSLLSADFPAAEGFDFAFRARASRFVSGDFFDYQPTDASHLSLVLADIAGKGLSAALLAASARSLYRLVLRHSIRACEEKPGEPSAILEQLNDELFADLELAERFITMQAARLDLEAGLLEFANAGGCPPVHFDGAKRTGFILGSGSLPLGILRSAKAETETLLLRPGQGVLFYSDGLSEAENPQGRLFGEERVLAETAWNAHLGVEEIADAILAAVDAFCEGKALSDDATLLLLKAKPRRHLFEASTTLDALDELPQRIARLCSPYGPEAATDMQLAASEAFSNIRAHGYDSSDGKVSVDLRLETRGIELVLTEWGRPFDPEREALTLPKPDEEGGRGLFLIRSVMDDFGYQAGGPDGNRWLFFKAIQD